MTRYRSIRHLFLPILACMCGASAMSVEAQPESEPAADPGVCEPGALVWSDEFDEDGLPNASRWRYDTGGHGWGNGELQYYTSARLKNVRVEDGSLIIKAHKESWGGRAYTSTRLLSRAEWTPSEIRGYVNETHYFTFANKRLTNSSANDRHWPFDHPFHLIFNIAVGGAWGGQQGVDPDIWPQRLQVDYVRVYGCDEVVSPNEAPVFGEGSTAQRSVAENTAAGQNIGGPVTATDANGDPLTYSLERTDASSFAIVSTSGQLRTKASLDYESKSSYAVTVRASDGAASTTIAVTITVTDETESPPPPPPPLPASTVADAPENLRAIAGNAEVTLRWDAPNDDGGADIAGYAWRHKESGGNFIAYTDIPESGPGEANARSYTVTGLTNGLEYVFHVRAV